MQIGDNEQFLTKDKANAIAEVIRWFTKTESDDEEPNWRKSYPFGVSQLLSELGYAKSVYCDTLEHFASLFFTNQPQG